MRSPWASFKECRPLTKSVPPTAQPIMDSQLSDPMPTFRRQIPKRLTAELSRVPRIGEGAQLRSPGRFVHSDEGRLGGVRGF